MGNLKEETFNNEDVQTHTLTEPEWAYLRLLNMALQFHTLGQRILSGFLYYIATTRLGYKEGSNLQFETDVNTDDRKVTIKLLPENFGQAPAVPEAPQAPTEPEAPKA